MKQIKALWKKHRLLLVGFILALLVTMVFTARFFTSLAYWPNNQDVEIRGWMTLGYVAHSYQVEEETLFNAAGLDQTPDHRIRISKLAELSNVTILEMETRILAAVTASRASQ